MNEIRCALVNQDPLPGTAGDTKNWFGLVTDSPWGASAVEEFMKENKGFKPLREIQKQDFDIVLLHDPKRAGTETGYGFEIKKHTLTKVDFRDSTKNKLDEIHFWVCTNGKRDVCCAVEGRKISQPLTEKYPGRVWECTHIGGHRFAAVMMVMPTEFTYGRLTPEQALNTAELADQGLVATDGLRGRCGDSVQIQIVDTYIRSLNTPQPVDATKIIETGKNTYEGTILDKTYKLSLKKIKIAPRPSSCGKSPSIEEAWVVDE